MIPDKIPITQLAWIQISGGVDIFLRISDRRWNSVRWMARELHWFSVTSLNEPVTESVGVRRTPSMRPPITEISLVVA